MSSPNSSESMLEIYLFETEQNIETLEACILEAEKSGSYSPDAINRIFRVMHTIKGSSAMMLYNTVSRLAHTMEDLFFYIRESSPQHWDCSALSDLVLEGVDVIKRETDRVRAGEKGESDASDLIDRLRAHLEMLKSHNPGAEAPVKQETAAPVRFYIAPDSKPTGGGRYYQAILRFDDGCEMENIRAYTVIHNLKDRAGELHHVPHDIIDESSVEVIRSSGFQIFFESAQSYEELEAFFRETLFLQALEFVQLPDGGALEPFRKPEAQAAKEQPIIPQPALSANDLQGGEKEASPGSGTHTGLISVQVAKLDKLMDLVGEMVIAEAMVTQNPDLEGLPLERFQKASRQLHKIVGELQDMVMSIRMVPLSNTFQKMHRIVRDMGRKLGKDVRLQLVGEQTEVDKKIIEHISDPLMHLVRNAIDHGLEGPEQRRETGKPEAGTVILEARNAGNEVWITVSDDGRGLNREKIAGRALEHGLTNKSITELSDREIYHFILMPGFSTKEAVSEFSGRGVGMDVVMKNLEAVGGSVSIDSHEGAGSAITLKIPLTLAIVEGMNLRVGASRYTVPIPVVRESFRPQATDIITDPDGREMILVRGRCYPIVRLHERFRTPGGVTELSEGILVMTEHEGNGLCLFADELLGRQQVVVKSLPAYLNRMRGMGGISGCTLLGDGSISLILDAAALARQMDT